MSSSRVSQGRGHQPLSDTADSAVTLLPQDTVFLDEALAFVRASLFVLD